MIFFSLIFCLFIALSASLDYDIVEVTRLSTLSNRLSGDKSLSIVNVSIFSISDQKKHKGKIGNIVFHVLKRIEQYEYSVQEGKHELRELSLLPAVEASGKGQVFVVNNPLFDRNHTLNNVRENHCENGICEGSYPSLEQHNLTTNGFKKLFRLLSTLAKRFGDGLDQEIQLVPLVLSRRVISLIGATQYHLNAGVALVALEQDGYKPLAAAVLNLKRKYLLPQDVPGGGDNYPKDYWQYDDESPYGQ